jgi:hypothetical protein
MIAGFSRCYLALNNNSPSGEFARKKFATN